MKKTREYYEALLDFGFAKGEKLTKAEEEQLDTPHGESRGILGSTTTACPCEVLHGVPERIGLGVSRPTIYADYANRRSPSLRMFVAAFMSLSWCSPHSGQTHSRTARSFVPVH
mgnify:CR=1 FL=1